jgi:hypothetical protein
MIRPGECSQHSSGPLLVMRGGGLQPIKKKICPPVRTQARQRVPAGPIVGNCDRSVRRFNLKARIDQSLYDDLGRFLRIRDCCRKVVAVELYAEVKPMFLHDGEADKGGIFDAFAAMDRNMTSSAGQDLAVVMFSGHGTMIDNQFYLVPYGADSSTTARLKASRAKSKSSPSMGGSWFCSMPAARRD